jgi:hypothetical protein
MDFKDTRWQSVDWIYFDQDRTKWRGFVNAVMKRRFPYVRHVCFLYAPEHNILSVCVGTQMRNSMHSSRQH